MIKRRQQKRPLMPEILMHLKLLLPYQILLDEKEVTHIVVETYEGSYGFLPHRLDCVAPITPGILTITRADESEIFVAVDEGILVKTSTDVLVSVRNAMLGDDLEKLQNVVQKEFLEIDEQARQVRGVMAKLESNFLHRFVNFQQK
jgi:F-type H+-transporting ATPase subunit epsilon